MKLNNKYILICSIFLIYGCQSKKSQFDIQSEKVTEIIKESSAAIQVKEYFPDSDVREELHHEFEAFYADRGYSLAWLSFDEPLEQTDQLLKAMSEAHKEGLDPNSYRIVEIEELRDNLFKEKSRKEARQENKARVSKNETIATEAKAQDTLRLNNLARLDFLLTSTYLTYASHLLNGKINPGEKEEWFSKPREADFSAHLADAIQAKNIEASLMDLVPKNKAYAQLKQSLATYREIPAESWKALHGQVDLKAGDRGSEVLTLKKRLVATGDLDAALITSADSIVFTPGLVDALKKYQVRHGLEENGKLNPQTLGSLTVLLQARMEQIMLNMERMRWLPDNFGEKYVLVNIPDYRLKLVEGEKTTLEMKVIVGKEYNATPIFSDTMEYVVFSPTWTVPLSIASEEMLPKIKKDPNYLQKNNLTIYDGWDKDAAPLDPKKVDWKKIDAEEFNYKIVEAPGRANSLGRIKFMFPNSLAIYLHDTPAGHLFERSDRSFSHGCIRVEKPVALAEYLLKDKGWDEPKIQEAMQQEEPEEVLLSEKLPVHLVYWTAWVGEDGSLQFREDIYKHDQKQQRARDVKDKELLSVVK